MDEQRVRLQTEQWVVVDRLRSGDIRLGFVVDTGLNYYAALTPEEAIAVAKLLLNAAEAASISNPLARAVVEAEHTDSDVEETNAAERAREALAKARNLEPDELEMDQRLGPGYTGADIYLYAHAPQLLRGLLADYDAATARAEAAEREAKEARAAMKPFSFTSDELFETASFTDDDVIYLRPDDNNDSVSNAWSKTITFADIRRVVAALLSDAPTNHPHAD